MKRLPTPRLPRKLPSPKAPYGNPLAVVKECVTFAIAAQQENTRRLGIEAQRDVAVARIQAESDLVQAYFSERFTERRDTLSGFFNMLSVAVENREAQTMTVALEGILGVLQHCPLQDFASFQKARETGTILEV